MPFLPFYGVGDEANEAMIPLLPEDYEKIRDHFSAIEANSRLGSQSNTAPWYVMDAIKRERTGLTSDGMCGACVIELYREFAAAITEYEWREKSRCCEADIIPREKGGTVEIICEECNKKIERPFTDLRQKRTSN
jgi:hypothetical protein